MSVASTFERLMLDLINQERTSRGLDPLTLELRLNDASEDHSTWMDQSGNFSHTGVAGSSPGDRMRDAGFAFSGSWTWGENIAFQSERGAPGIADDVADLHRALMNSPGHRANILNPNFDLIGIGIEEGDNRGFDAVYVTQNFARTSAPVQIDTGPSGNPLIGTSGNDTLIGNEGNNRMLGAGGNDNMNGQGGNDTIFGGKGADKLFGGAGDDQLNGGKQSDDLNGGTGNDTLKGGNGNDKAKGGSGDDKVMGNGGNDAVFGDPGQDVVRGGVGDDSVFGGGGRDQVYGGVGRDQVFGNAGNDLLYGGADNDRVDGGSGNDRLTGGAGGDIFVFSPGRDIATDFNAAQSGEKIDLSGVVSITGFNDLMSGRHIRQSGDNAVIDDLGGNTLTLLGVDLTDLGANDFLF